MGTTPTEYTEAQWRLALKQMQSALATARRPAARSRREVTAAKRDSRRSEEQDGTFEAGMFQECGLLV